MALADAVLAVADALRDVVNELKTKELTHGERTLLTSFASFVPQLYLVVKAAENSSPPPADAATFHAVQTAKAREEFRGKNPRQEEAETRLVEVVSGPAQGTMAPVAGDMPAFAFMKLSGDVYQMGEDGRLRHVTSAEQPPTSAPPS